MFQRSPRLSQIFAPHKYNTARTIFFFVVLTMVLTGVVIITWEKVFLRPVYAIIEGYYPGETLRAHRMLVQQRVEHFVISVTVDAVVVTILLAVVRRQQRKLSDSEEQYRLLFESNPEPMWVLDEGDLHFVSVNDAAIQLYGYDRREFLSLKRADVCLDPAESQQKLSVHHSSPPEHPALAPATEYHRRKDGTIFPVESSGHRIEFEGRPATLMLVRDITERRAVEAAVSGMQTQLARNERIAALGRAAAQVAHEVKNPLAGLRLYSLHLKSRTAGKLSDAETAMVDKIADGIARLSVTTEQILNFARPVELVPATVDLHQVMNDVLQVSEPQLKENRVTVDTVETHGPFPVMIDEAAIHAALLNLVLNAIQAMPEGGTLRVESQKVGNIAHLVIRDTGKGMTPEQIANVFEPFYTTKSQGLGLGLPFAKKIIDQHSGTIVVNSKPGAGTEIVIELPV
jgi:PAS domain S-box-containing protein